MSDIELIIKIPENTYEMYKSLMLIDAGGLPTVAKSIANGILLPKGHGDLIDRNGLSLVTVHLIDGIFVCDAPTIIEADRSDEE